MNNCKEYPISYAPIYLNLVLHIFYIIIQHVRNKKHTEQLNHIKKELTSSQLINENRQSKDLNELKKIIIDILDDSDKSIDKKT